jgi:hypothetical protein
VPRLYAARQELGRLVRVYAVDTDEEPSADGEIFFPRKGEEGQRRMSGLCRPGFVVHGYSPEQARQRMSHLRESLTAELTARLQALGARAFALWFGE